MNMNMVFDFYLLNTMGTLRLSVIKWHHNIERQVRNNSEQWESFRDDSNIFCLFEVEDR